MHTKTPLPDPIIFKAYDIRGIVDEQLTETLVYDIGRALAGLAHERAVGEIALGRDGRLSGPKLLNSLAAGLNAGGIDVVDIGLAPTPLCYFAGFALKTMSSIAITGSHNPANYNGLKMVIGQETLALEAITDLRERIIAGHFPQGQGRLRQANVTEDYMARLRADIKLARPLNVVIDCGNGVTGMLAEQLFTDLGCQTTVLYGEVDGRFPNHHPDPSKPENLADLIAAVDHHQADIGLAFDGDGDRLGVILANGEQIFPDRLLMLFAQQVLSALPGAPIVYDVKCSRHLASWIRQLGGQARMGCTGHALIKKQMKDLQAPLAGEMSGHFFFKHRWYGFDDALYAAARLLEILAAREQSSVQLCQTLPISPATPEITIKFDDPHAFVRQLSDHQADFNAQEIITIDGLRVEYSNGFGLIRASNTMPLIVMRFEADDDDALTTIQQRFYNVLRSAFPERNWPYNRNQGFFDG